MLIGLVEPLTVGKAFPLTLRFKRSEPLTVQVTVHDGPPPRHGEDAKPHD
jgi:copper(I)-binding protein